MARFTGHESCPKCGSRNNLARYDDGSAFCFGCKYSERRTSIPSNGGIHGGNTKPAARRTGSDILGEPAVEWLRKYDLTVSDLPRNLLTWDPTTQQAIFEFRDKEGVVCCTQARNFSSERAANRKYDNVGSAYEAFPLFTKEDRDESFSRTCVITEDTLSGLKVSRQVDAIPCLGTNFPIHKITELYKRGYQRVVVWLDSDKWREGRDIADKCKWLGLSATTLLTELDPKCYDDLTIRKYLTCQQTPNVGT